jgi:cytochrome c oxidase cbb3-type subunit III
MKRSTRLQGKHGSWRHRRAYATSVFVLGLGLTCAIGLRAAEQATASQTGPKTAPAAQDPPAQRPAEPAQRPAEQPAHGGPEAPPRPQDREDRARFPAHQRPPVDPAVLERGRAQYAGRCSACHGADARGGQLGGPNLLRSELALADQDGELIIPVVQNGRPGPPPMPPIQAPVEDIKAIVSFIHSLQAQGSNQGGPPPGPEQELKILVGDAAKGESFFAANCASCHSPTGDLQGIASRVSEPAALQNLWVSGGRATARGERRRGGPRPQGKPTLATVTLANGQQISGVLVKLDDFIITLALEDGTTRSVRRTGDTPRVEVQDPLAKHRELLSVLTNANMHDVTAYLATLK